jgi:hypothetical protein
MAMKKTIAIVSAIFLAGCSNVPDASDIRDQLEQGWAGCPGIKIIDLKKTNGISHGNTYEMAVSWKFEVLKDTNQTVAGGLAGGLCSDDANAMNFIQVASRDPRYVNANGELKKGDEIEISDVFNMVKSENGWIVK